MKKSVLFLLFYSVVALSFLHVQGDVRTERELRTLEGTYLIEGTVANVDQVNVALGRSPYFYEETLDDPAINIALQIQVTYRDGHFDIVGDGLSELTHFNASVATDGSAFYLSIRQRIGDSQVPNIGVSYDATVPFDQPLMRFENPVLTRSRLVIISTEGNVSNLPADINMTLTFLGRDQDTPLDEEPDASLCEPLDVTMYEPLYGRIVMVRYGREITMRRADCSEAEPRRNMFFSEGTYFETQAEGYLELNLNESHRIRVRPNTKMLVGTETMVKVEQGRTLFNTLVDTWDEIKDQLTGDYQVETPMAVAGIRGTTFIVDVEENGETTFILFEGSIELLTNLNETVLLDEPGRVFIDSQGETVGVEPLTAEDHLRYDEFHDDALFPEEVAEDGEETQSDASGDEDSNLIFAIILIVVLVSPIVLLLVIIIKLKRRFTKRKG